MKDKDIRQGEIFLHYLVGVDQDFYKNQSGGESEMSQNTIMPDISKLTYDAAKHQGFQRAVGHASSLFSQRFYQQTGFEEMARIDYKDFLFNGDAVFAGIKWHRRVVMYEKSLVS